MAFTVYGPGIRDEIYLDTLFRHPVIGQVTAAHAVHPVAEQPVYNEAENPPPTPKQSRASVKPAVLTDAPSREVVAAHIMSSPVVTVLSSEPATRVYELFASHGFRHIPVLDRNGHAVVGIVSDRDMFGVAPSTNSKQALLIEDVMHVPVVTVTPDCVISDIASALYRGRIGALPVVDAQGSLLGIVTRSDVMKLVMHSTDTDLWL